jgi:hypothetical protein
MRRLLVTANVVPSSPILVSFIIGELCPSETSIFTRATLPNIPEGGFLYSHRRENLKSLVFPDYFALFLPSTFLKKATRIDKKKGQRRKQKKLKKRGKKDRSQYAIETIRATTSVEQDRRMKLVGRRP